MAKHSREDSVTKDKDGDVVNMRGTITEAPGDRPYANRPQTEPKHSKQ